MLIQDQVHHHELIEDPRYKSEVWLVDHIAARSAQPWFFRTIVSVVL